MASKDLCRLRVKLIGQHVKEQEEVIDSIYHAAIKSLADKRKKLSERTDSIKINKSLSEGDKAELQYFLKDEMCFESEQVLNVCQEMVIVVLYKTIEISIKRMAQSSGLFTGKEVKLFYNFRSLKNKFSQKVVDIVSLPGYESYNELRCINNSIKHIGKVSPELANFNNWTEGDELKRLWCHYQRLKPEVYKFMASLSKKVIEKIP